MGLSNGDRTSLGRAVANLSIPVDRIVSAEQAGAYKLHPGVYRSAVEACDERLCFLHARGRTIQLFGIVYVH